jgi:DNA-3-methyladenine glycosylase I
VGKLSTTQRCGWAQQDALLRAYHDREWGVPVRDSRRLWELLMLEGFQAGLAWITVLRKRAALRKAFAGFVPAKVARFGHAEVTRLMRDPGIIRARAKIEATIRGAQIYLDMQRDGERFSDFCWSFTQGEVMTGNGRTRRTSSALSGQIARELKRRGFRFVGPTIVYAWMQAVGIVNDHSLRCYRRRELTGRLESC